MGDLGVENSLTVDPILFHEGTGIFTEVVEDLNDCSIFQDVLKSKGERIDLQQVNHITILVKSYLKRLAGKGNVPRSETSDDFWLILRNLFQG